MVVLKMVRCWGGGLFHGQHYKDSEKIPLHPIRDHRNVHTKTCMPENKTKLAHLYCPYKIRNTTSQTHNQIQVLTKMLSLVHANIDPCRQKHVQTKPHKDRGQKHTQVAAAELCLLSLLPLGSSSFFSVFQFWGYLYDSASIPCFLLLILSFILGLGVLPW